MKTLLDIFDVDKLVFNPAELGCVLYLPGLPGGGDRLYDRSPYANNGTITGATWRKSTGGIWHLHYDGTDDYVSAGKGASLSITGALTIIAWINKTGSEQRYILGNYDGGGNNAQYVLQSAIGTYLSFVSRTAAGGKFQVTGTTLTISTGKWHQVVVTRHAADGLVTLYVDGQADATTGTSNPAQICDSDARGNTCIGQSGDYPGERFDGDIVLPRVFKRALSPLEIQNYYHREKHLLGAW